MRLKNYPDVETITVSEPYELRDGITIQITALPPDYDDSTEAELPSPEPKRLGLEKDRKGNAVTDANGRAVFRYDTEDPDYKKAVARNGKLQAMKMFVDGLAPEQIEFTVKPTDDHAAYYRAVLMELKSFGFSMGHLLGAVKAIGRISGISDDDLKAAEAGFSGEGN